MRKKESHQTGNPVAGDTVVLDAIKKKKKKKNRLSKSGGQGSKHGSSTAFVSGPTLSFLPYFFMMDCN
jgi:hypothetical protein